MVPYWAVRIHSHLIRWGNRQYWRMDPGPRVRPVYHEVHNVDYFGFGVGTGVDAAVVGMGFEVIVYPTDTSLSVRSTGMDGRLVDQSMSQKKRMVRYPY